MAPNVDRDPTRFFSVVGAPYIHERRSDEFTRRRRDHESSEVRPPETGVAVLWLVFYGAIFGFSLFASGGAAKLIEMAGLMVK